MKKKTLSIIASFRNEEKSIKYFCKRINSCFSKYNNITYKIYFINDFSTDNSESIIKRLKKNNKKIILASTNKNYGGSHSIHYGFSLIPNNQFATVIDCDLQDPPEILVKEFIKSKKDTLVNFKRKERNENFFQLFYTNIAYKVLSLISFGKIISNSNYFKIIPPYIVKKIKKSTEIYPFWNYFICQYSKKNKIVLYKRKKRSFGKTKFGIFSTNPWATFYSALYYFMVNSYFFFIFLIFLNFLAIVNSKELLLLNLLFKLLFFLQAINFLSFTIFNIFKFFKKRIKVQAKLFS